MESLGNCEKEIETIERSLEEDARGELRIGISPSCY